VGARLERRVADARHNAGLKRPPIEVDTFEHVVASPERTLLRVDGRYPEGSGGWVLDATLVVDDGESVRRHRALPDANLVKAGLAEDEEWFWRAAFVVSSAYLRDQRTAFALEAEPGVLIDLPFPVERLVPLELAGRAASGGRFSGRQAVALGLALTIALSSSSIPALADTHMLNVHGPDGKVTQVPATGGVAATPAPPPPSTPQQAPVAAAPADPVQPAPQQPQPQQQPQPEVDAPDVTTPTPSTDSSAPVQQGDHKAEHAVKQEHPGSGHHSTRRHSHPAPHHQQTASPRRDSAPHSVAPAPHHDSGVATQPPAFPKSFPNGVKSFDQLPSSSTSSVPNLLIQRFHVPIFLLPIYQAAGIQYGIRWEVLAAINEIETDYGRNLNVSSAGALGWMQFMPSTWKTYGTDANMDHKRDPYNPVDAIFSAARYLKAAGGDKNIRQGIFAYNHAGWYVDSVMLRAKLLAGLPADFVGSLTGLTEGRFPVAAKARYADAVTKKDAMKTVKPGQNAANLDQGTDTRTGIEIYAQQGAPVVAANDGVVKKIGKSRKLGRYVILQDVYGNQYTYAGLGSVAKLYPVPKDDPGKSQNDAAAVKANDPKPTQAASAGANADSGKPAKKARKDAKRAAAQAPAEQEPAPQPAAAIKRRLFAHPQRTQPQQHGGFEQMLDQDASFDSYQNMYGKPLGLDAKNATLRKLKAGSHVVASTVLGTVGTPAKDKPSYLYFEVRPAGKGAPLIDPKPILDGWKLLEDTKVYRPSGRNVLYGEGDPMSIGEVMLLPKPLLEKRVLSDPRIKIYDAGRKDIETGQIDRRVLATLEFLADSGLNPTVSCLKSGHSFLTASGNVSEHSSGDAVDISEINGVPILGHQGKGSITETTVRKLMTLQGTMQPHQIISLMDLGKNTLALPDHYNHIHVGFHPLFGENTKLGEQVRTVLKPGQWTDLVSRLRSMENPVVPTQVSKYALPDKSSHRP
jgi:hypothetical protein